MKKDELPKCQDCGAAIETLGGGCLFVDQSRGESIYSALEKETFVCYNCLKNGLENNNKMSNSNPKPILIIEVPTYVGDLIAVSEESLKADDFIKGVQNIEDWHIMVIQTQKPEFDYRVFYSSGIPETLEAIKDSPGDCPRKPSPAADALVDQLLKGLWVEHFHSEKEDKSFTVTEVFCNENPEAGGISRAFFMTPKSQCFPKVAKTEQEAFDIEEKFSDIPHGFIQWQGTEVCMDVHCKCGESFHIDATFAFYVKCPECETIYSVNSHVELIELLDKSVNFVTTDKDEPR